MPPQSPSIIMGLSPRVRGNLEKITLSDGSWRSIPACAGEPGPRAPISLRKWVYPRVCGGTRVIAVPPSNTNGLSPRVRGNQTLAQWEIVILRVYPRVCGGTQEILSHHGHIDGLSPRVRGNPDRIICTLPPGGSIPACAGEPRTWAIKWKTTSVYPRVCGGTWYDRDRNGVRIGLSPRVRGNPVGGVPTIAGLRSIPACAGEPSVAGAVAARLTVYPRVCGGTKQGRSLCHACSGLSPRVRGNHKHGYSNVWSGRSIPACAGEPLTWWRRSPITPVYPRVCGGTSIIDSSITSLEGLSPRVRGNQYAGRF